MDVDYQPIATDSLQGFPRSYNDLASQKDKNAGDLFLDPATSLIRIFQKFHMLSVSDPPKNNQEYALLIRNGLIAYIGEKLLHIPIYEVDTEMSRRDEQYLRDLQLLFVNRASIEEIGMRVNSENGTDLSPEQCFQVVDVTVSQYPNQFPSQEWVKDFLVYKSLGNGSNLRSVPVYRVLIRYVGRWNNTRHYEADTVEFFINRPQDEGLTEEELRYPENTVKVKIDAIP